MIKKITFEEIYPVWKNYLWPERTSAIEPQSAMLFLSGYDLKNFDYPSTFFGYFLEDILVGVNSGHLCIDRSYRSRGLFVMPEYRGKGIGKNLLIETIKQGIEEKAKFIWSLPRRTSWNTYAAAGFDLVTEWQETETSINAFCRKEL